MVYRSSNKASDVKDVKEQLTHPPSLSSADEEVLVNKLTGVTSSLDCSIPSPRVLTFRNLLVVFSPNFSLFQN